MAERTVFDLFRHDVERPREEHYVHYYPGGRRAFSTEGFLRSTARLAEGLAGLGVGRGDRVMLLSDNRPEWHMADLAVISLGGVDVPVYGTLTAAQLAYQARDSGAVAAIVDSAAQAEKLLQGRDSCPELRHVIQIEGTPAPAVTRFTDVVSSGESPGVVDRFWTRAEKARPEDLITIIYTSGTTGEPKGVRLSHLNLVSNVVAATPRVPISDSDLALEFLPLCHVFERMLGYAYMWRATRRAYCSVAHAGELLPVIRPTVFAAVPRVYEKVRTSIMTKAAASPAKARLFAWAVEVGTRAANQRIAGRPLSGGLALQHRIADRLVLGKVRDALGGRIRYCISGGAALSLEVNQFFHALGIQLMEGYGLTETSPVIAVNGPAQGFLRLGSVGKPLDNVELKLASDGELLVRGPSVTSGYWNKPEATAEAFDEEGFFRTGDVADLDDDGFLLITDRKKDILVTAGGKNVAPQPIENDLKRSPLVDAAVLIGDARPFISVLISPNQDELVRWAKQEGIATKSFAELVEEPRVVAAYERVVETVNAGLARYEQIKRVRVLPVALSLDGGHLTPTLKVKRRVVERQFESFIEEIYSGGENEDFARALTQPPSDRSEAPRPSAPPS